MDELAINLKRTAQKYQDKNMNLKPRIEILQEKKLIGNRLTMSLASNKTGELWRSFMPRRREISNNLSNDLISMQIYKPSYFAEINPLNEFEKWATVEVSDYDNRPTDMETYTLSGGLYAVFDYKGLSTDKSIYQYIFGTWLPGSDYLLDDRPHFEVLGEKYKNAEPVSEEEIWIPIRQK
ncbi:MAG: GyrI-like domain-containing protein [Lentimicrobium sp.]|nr:GyrI-like domain-containing protein [Lentimicrobium sp.]